MTCDPQEFELNEAQKKELSDLMGNFLAKYFSKEVVLTLGVEMNFFRMEEKSLLRITHGCVSGGGDEICGKGYHWS